jgi:hypothetical protein
VLRSYRNYCEMQGDFLNKVLAELKGREVVQLFCSGPYSSPTLGSLLKCMASEFSVNI